MNDITPKEASEILSHYTDLGYGIVIEGEDTSKIKQALSLASKTLANGTPYNPTGDCISREQVLKELMAHQYSQDFCKEHNIEYSINCSMMRIIVNDAQTVEPGRSGGEWVGIADFLKHLEELTGNRYSASQYYDGSLYCNHCWAEGGTTKTNFCPNCGADMRKGDIDG